MSQTRNKRIIIAITGASGVIYGIRALELLKSVPIETHLVISKAGERTIRHETNLDPRTVRGFADYVYPAADIGAAIASGSFRTDGMLVAPASVRTMGEIATGVTSGLVSRAADVVLKERRRLVLLARETPLHVGHLRTMTRLSEMGAVIMPPVPAFYSLPKTLEDMVDQTVARAFDLFGLELDILRRWQGLGSDGAQDETG